MTFDYLSRAYGYEPEDPPEIPDSECRRLLETFYALSERRQEGYASVRPLTFSDIEAYGRLLRIEFGAEFVQALLQIDRRFIDACSEVRADQKARE